jgi:hypothetical protein
MKKIPTPSPVVLGVITLITVVFWIAFGIIRIVTTTEEIDVPPEILAPLTPTLDTSIISSLENKIYLSETEIGNSNFQIQIFPPSEGLNENPLPSEATQSAELNATVETVPTEPVASQEGELAQ